jgi:hypothetical protein
MAEQNTGQNIKLVGQVALINQRIHYRGLMVAIWFVSMVVTPRFYR